MRTNLGFHSHLLRVHDLDVGLGLLAAAGALLADEEHDAEDDRRDDHEAGDDDARDGAAGEAAVLLLAFRTIHTVAFFVFFTTVWNLDFK